MSWCPLMILQALAFKFTPYVVATTAVTMLKLSLGKLSIMRVPPPLMWPTWLPSST